MAKECKVVPIKKNNQRKSSIVDPEESKVKASSVYYESLLGIEKMISDHFETDSKGSLKTKPDSA